jgi:oligoendopeptidase F
LLKNEDLGAVYVELIKVRNEISREKGYSSYSEYAYKESYRRQYSNKDFAEMRSYIKSELVPIYNTLATSINLEDLSKANEFMCEAYSTRLGKTVEPVLNSISEEMLTAFEEMYDNKMCNIYFSEKKADMSFTAYIQGYNKPFLFSNPSKEPTVSDFFALMHEFGHYYAYCTVPVNEINCNDLDSHEVLSQGLELIVAERMGDVFDDNKLSNVAYLTVVAQILSSIIEGCKMDEFQERVFALENPTVVQINKIYGDVMSEYGFDFYDTGDGASLSWVDVPHNFIAPFYYVSYTVSAVAAMQIWSMENSQEVYFNFLNGTENGLFLENLKANDILSPFDKGALEKVKKEIISRTERVGVDYNV